MDALGYPDDALTGSQVRAKYKNQHKVSDDNLWHITGFDGKNVNAYPLMSLLVDEYPYIYI